MEGPEWTDCPLLCLDVMSDEFAGSNTSWGHFILPLLIVGLKIWLIASPPPPSHFLMHKVHLWLVRFSRYLTNLLSFHLGTCRADMTFKRPLSMAGELDLWVRVLVTKTWGAQFESLVLTLKIPVCIYNHRAVGGGKRRTAGACKLPA